MNTPPEKPPAQNAPASFRSRFVTQRTTTIVGVLLVIALVIMFTPW